MTTMPELIDFLRENGGKDVRNRSGRMWPHIYVYFPNGWRASIIQPQGTQEDTFGTFELAVVGRDGHLSYDTPITKDTLRHQSKEQINELLERISGLQEWPATRPRTEVES